MSETERDRELDRAWRAASREEPPAALDDAVRAQARRAVAAAPGARPRHAWRYPAAAAATVALLAFGIAQMTSRDEVEPPAAAKMQSRTETTRQDEAAQEERLASPPPVPGAASGTAANAPAGAPSVQAWIARIRDLRARGEREAAAKELAAFRAAYGERASELLPPDLRDGAAPK